MVLVYLLAAIIMVPLAGLHMIHSLTTPPAAVQSRLADSGTSMALIRRELGTLPAPGTVVFQTFAPSTLQSTPRLITSTPAPMTSTAAPTVTFQYVVVTATPLPTFTPQNDLYHAALTMAAATPYPAGSLYDNYATATARAAP